MKEIFDFDAIGRLLRGDADRPPLKIRIDAMHGGRAHLFLSHFTGFYPVLYRNR